MPEMLYNDPANGTESANGVQKRLFVWDRNSLMEMQKEQYFTQMSSVENMPRNYGKTITKYHWLPVLDARNKNDQGLDASGAFYADGNLYGSSKDVGTITSKLPIIGETGGRVNRVGFTRIDLSATITQLGLFDEYSRDLTNFDSEENLTNHYRRELMYAANELSEDALQLDLLNAAGIIRFGGIATVDTDMTGEGSDVSVVDYNDFMRTAIDLRNNRTPVKTKLITGSKLTDTAVISDGFPLYVGSEMLPTLRKMADSFGDRAFIPVQKYAAAGTIMRGEVGTIDQFRIIVVPEMMKWEGAGATETAANLGYSATGGKYDVFPLLAVGGGSFTTIGFQSDGVKQKYEVIDRKPGPQTADRTDPFGKIGFTSIQWWYGTLIERAERIALMKSVAEM